MTTDDSVRLRDDLTWRYLETLPFTPYPVQEQAIFAWFAAKDGVLVCAPTGTGKTLIAEAAAFEALHSGSTMYYTTPLIALTDQKFHELQDAAERWGFSRDDVGLVTGNRAVNPHARVLVVVAEILLNRLLQPDQFDFRNVSAVVMDEFHCFSDPERGIVWEFSLGLLPAHVRVLLLSATVGNAVSFLSWVQHAQQRRLDLVQSSDRKVPLSYSWVPDKLLNEHLEEMARGSAEGRRVPALVFCFNRDECWSVAEELTGRAMLVAEDQQGRIVDRLERFDLSKGAGPKLKRILMRGVGVHHAGLLPRYRRIVEELFQQKLLSVCVCTETLSAGINLPARSVVVTSLLKGMPGKQRLIDSSTAHQIFGRAGRPQFDTQGYVYALPHEDDVKILRWKEKYDQIPEDTRDPKLLQAKKAMKKKMPTRSPNRQYWSEAQFEKLKIAPPRDLASQGELPWRMLTYMLQLSPDVERVRQLVRRRLMEPKRAEQSERQLHHMLRTLHVAGVVTLEPEPPPLVTAGRDAGSADRAASDPLASAAAPAEAPSAMARLLLEALQHERKASGAAPLKVELPSTEPAAPPAYRPERAYPTPRLRNFFAFRGINPVYGLFLVDQFDLADETERLQALESVLELPRSLIRSVRVPPPDRMPPGPLARERLDNTLVSRGLIAAGDLYPPFEPDLPPEERKYAPALGEKLRMLFDADYPNVHGVFVNPVWAAGEIREFGFDFHAYISARQLAKQEGLIFRHLLRLSLLLLEFAQISPANVDPAVWRTSMETLAEQFTSCCRQVDPQSTEHALADATKGDLLIPRATPAPAVQSAASNAIEKEEVADDTFGAGIFDDE